MGAGAASGAARTASVLVAMESSMKTTPPLRAKAWKRWGASGRVLRASATAPGSRGLPRRSR